MMDAVLISPEALRETMAQRRYSVRKLAFSAEMVLVRDHRKGRPEPTLSRSTMGHLVSGSRRYCRPDRAAAIEEVLDVTPGTLFRVKVQPDEWFREHVPA